MREAEGGDGARPLPPAEEARSEGTGPEETAPDQTGPEGTRPRGEPDRADSAAGHGPPPTFAEDGRGAGRFWSRRRVPAALLAVLVLAGTGLLLYDVVAVRADHSAMHWRRELARELGERPLDDTAVLVGAGVAAALGLWLLVLAATPGQRKLLPMRRTDSDVRAGLERTAAAMMLRDRAMDVPGVQSVRVRVRRSKVRVRAVSHFRDPDDVRDDLDTALAGGVDDLGLARPPGVLVRVTRPGRKG
ncbi:hypothetical protein DCW30_33975 [Streptomyces alfalfae]|uniref:DUF6286 domain-containing protein n=1 Tax=Streptomyces alfalfae TaxID=1642299 RepID=A0A1P8TN22_9ACTN|nr:DUF6286 domain-containing protein [Streptomyces alfalfae]AYA19402.1 hypothetical protein D3X13_26910 [Streptomyces fradiae]APY88984.1 hypothetical protein A7J05_27730 [Streptomyces alfalfae]QQC88612.1 hypothetical protein I8755_09495 [Streptomyces alfalfae]QUI31071.1 hypothetical protein H9W91_09565 [Streptomyces alfalfae]RXX35669.1 hypothetical protein DCW30_33975 [Streptomyces alfalfae]